MSQNVTVNGTTYAFPTNLETNWGTVVTNWAAAVSSSTLQKNGGTFTLTAEVDFGATYGLKSAYFKSQGTNVASSGVIRLANAEQISFRNAANSADLALSVNSSNQLTFAGNPVTGSSALTGSRAAVTAADGSLTTAATTSTEIGYVSGVTSSIQTQIGTKITSGAAAIVNADVSASAAIARSKLATGTNDHVVINSGAGAFSSEAQLAISRGGTGQSTANAALNALLPSQSGHASQYLKSDGTDSSWATLATPAFVSKTANYTLTTSDDFIGVDTSGGSVTITLPTAVSNTGKTFFIQKTTSDTNTVTIATTSSQTVGGRASSSIVLAALNDFLECFSNNTNWLIRAKNETAALTSTSTATSIGVGTAVYQSMSGNNVTLTPGKWRVGGYIALYTGGSTQSGFLTAAGFFAANGTGTTTAPTALTAPSGQTSFIVEGGGGQCLGGPSTSAGGGYIFNTGTVSFDITVTSNTTVYLVGKAFQSTGTGGTTTATIWANRIF